MLDGLLGRGFTSKCKSLIKPTRTRIEVLRRREEAKQRFLKEDLAKLLANGLDINAYGRTEEFLAGLGLLSCYDFIELSCEYIVKNLSLMQKQRECPEVCRETVSSLMFAAARFSDLPELRELRDIFQERYGNSLEGFVNRVFVEKLASKPPPMEKRLQLLKDIASEFSIKWDFRGFEKRMASLPVFDQQDQHKKYEPFQVSGNKYNLPNLRNTLVETDKHDASSKGRNELVVDGHKMRNGRDNVLRRDELDHQFFVGQEPTGSRQKPLTNRGEIMLRGEEDGISLRGRQEFAADKHGLLNGKEDIAVKTIRSGSSSRSKKHVHTGGSPGPLSRGKSEAAVTSAQLPVKGDGEDGSSADNDRGSQRTSLSSTRKVQEQETDGLRPHNSALPPPYIKSKGNVLPPPYIKPKDSKYGATTERKHAVPEYDGSIDPSNYNRSTAVNSSDGNQKELNQLDYRVQDIGPARINSHGREKDHHYQDDIPLPKPRSVRRKHSKSSSSQDDVGNLDAGVARRSSSSRRREHSRKGLQILFDDDQHKKDEEERVIDKLLLHYSKKPSTYEEGKLRNKSQAHPSHQIAADVNRSPHKKSRDGHDVESEMVPPPSRSVSLPREPSAPSDIAKVFTRANSFQPDNRAMHVHPKLPDYDELAARFAALRGL